GLNATHKDAVSAGDCEGAKLITRTWSLIDHCGNLAADQIQLITVKDSIKPTFTRPINLTIYTDGSCGYDSTVAKTGDVNNEADNCSTGLNATHKDVVSVGPCQGSYVITRTWCLVDKCGNKAAKQVQTITVSDSIKPTITAP